ncbi:MAG: transglutaminase-like domain-containing protein [Clostridiales Family XIII bacterium]|nr:transglutaminase-like domain-containing protein [Clostridiales Family XIII bacterium]
MKKKAMKTGVRVLIYALTLAALCPLPVYGTPDLSEYTKPSELVQSDDAIGKAWAEYIVETAGAETETEKIRAIYAWYTRNMEYDHDIVLRVRDLPAAEQMRRVPRYDYLSVLAAVADYAAGLREDKPKNLCGGYAYGVAGSLRALGIPVKIEMGRVSRTVKKGETYFDENGKQRVSKGKGETPYRYYNGRWIKLADAHARLSIWDETKGRWISADPAFDSVSGDDSYFDMSAAKYANRWTFLYVSSERMPLLWKENPLPDAEIAPPPALPAETR